MRNRVCISWIVLILVSSGLSASTLALAGENDVPMFRGNAARTGEMPGPGPSSENGITERWHFLIGGSVNSSPAVVDGVIYVGSSDGNLYAIEAATGSERWRFNIGDVVDSSPAVVDGVVYVTSDDGLYALEERQLTLENGGQAVTRNDVPLRGAPAQTGVEREELNKGTLVTITGEIVVTDGIVWWPVTVNETDSQGWIEAEDLEPTANAPAQ